MPGISQLRPAADGGPLRGGAPRVVWESLDADPHTVSARSAAQRLIQQGRSSHLVWNPVSGDIVQLIPAVRAACALGAPATLVHAGPPDPDEAGTAAGTAEQPPAARGGPRRPGVNAEGRLCVQICVVAFAWDPFTSGPLAGLKPIMEWLGSWLIPRTWPAGRPAEFPHGIAAPRSRRLWARGGHFGASQVPDSPAIGPGAVDIRLLTGPSAHESRPPMHSGHDLDDLDDIFVSRPDVPAPLSRAS
ncbi:MAG: hypothetical protein ACLPUO_16450 [Streptosporangiaceae bacterium]|jgi:hypothetical protein